MKIIRVFPRRTRATPTDELAVVGRGPLMGEEADEIHVSVTYTWDIPKAEKLAQMWAPAGKVLVAGPAMGTKGEDFIPGKYVAPGYVITSRGCPNKCWFCTVWRRDGHQVRELPIVEGGNILDDNLLACSEPHIRAVFAMLKKYKHPEKGPMRRIEFTGGIEAKRMTPTYAELFVDLKPNQIFMAYDTPDDWEPMVEAVRLLKAAGINMASHPLRAYVLIGWPKDTFEAAEARCRQVLSLGVMPMSMLFRDKAGKAEPRWRKFQWEWSNPTIVGTKLRTGSFHVKGATGFSF